MKIPHDPDEIIAVVDDKDKVIGACTRKEAHQKGVLHKEVYVYVINSKQHLLLQKRKDTGLWDHSAAGHFIPKQTYLQAAQREFEEELGVFLNKKEFIKIGEEKFIITKPNKINNRLSKIFLVKKDVTKFHTDPAEVEKIYFFDKKELIKLLESHEITDCAKTIIEKYFLELL